MSAASATPAPATAGAASAKKARKPVGPLVTAWLLAYNVLATAAWSYVLFLIAQHFAEGGSIETLYGPIHRALYFAQSLAVMEVLHALFRFVPSPVATTALQVASRIMLVWGIFYPVPETRTTLGFFLATLVSHFSLLYARSAP
jgi:very-long-chain (3R)-3-hydroxyacyl-CoA dehydratase